MWPAPPPGITPAVLQRFQATFNHSQLLSIRHSAERRSGLTLIQGPPGTGKTTTVIGILNAIHLMEYHTYYEALLRALLGDEGLGCRNSRAKKESGGLSSTPGLDPAPWLNLVSRVSRHKPHLLVAAPSNVAVDNIVQRIIQRGFFDGQGSKYNPSILRVGGGKSLSASAVREVSLDEIIEADDEKCRQGSAAIGGVSLGPVMPAPTGPVTEADRRAFLKVLEARLLELTREVFQYQGLLLNLRLAFGNHALPPGWEIRVDSYSGAPYWVDHINECVSMAPPAPPPPEPEAPPPGVLFGHPDQPTLPPPPQAPRASQLKCPLYPTHTELPEFKIYAAKACQCLEELDKIKLMQARCKMRVDPHSYGGPAAARQLIESNSVDTAHVVFSTLNSSASPILEMSEFQITLVDEAAQCSEPSLLIALRKGCRQCIMVGDPQQLPATIFSESAKRKGYGRSLFERLMLTGQPSILLDVQYRMAPGISAFPNYKFYGGRVRDGGNVQAQGFFPDYVGPLEAGQHESALLDPFLFLDLGSSSDGSTRAIKAEASSSSASASATDGTAKRNNPQEALLCLSLLRTMLGVATKWGGLGSVGIITPYQEQLSELRRVFREAGMEHGTRLMDLSGSLGQGYGSRKGSSASLGRLDIELNTVDGFQGREKDFVIISCVRANDHGSIGFLSDKRRMNVALTRARYGLYVIGNAQTLRQNALWGGLIEHADEGRALVRVPHASADLLGLLQQRRGGVLYKRPRVTEVEDGEEEQEMKPTPTVVNESKEE